MIEILNNKVMVDNLEHLFNSTQIGLFWKDNQGKYLGVNSEFLRHANKRSDSDIIGGTDFDFWAQYAPGLRDNDQAVIYTERPKIVIERCVSFGEIAYFRSFKSPFYARNGKRLGVFGAVTLLNTEKDRQRNIKLHTLAELTKRQAECLYYLTKGKTAKEIAELLCLSHRSIEHYIEAIKIKWDCKNRSKLIEKAELYFHHFSSNQH